jgi:hypothetical protein
VLHAADPSGLVPERAVHNDLGLAHRLGRGFRWQAGLFDRRERDVLRAPQPGAPVTNGLAGHARGVELLLERRCATGLSGWAAYSYGLSRQTDVERNEEFWSDFDQRHAVNLSARYAFSNRAMASVTFRSGSNFPLPGYFTERDGRLYVGEVRNAIRLPLYARLDVRAQKTFTRGTRRFTIFGEVLNVLDRTNIGSAQGFYRPGSGEAVGFTEALFPRLPSAGLRIDF